MNLKQRKNKNYWTEIKKNYNNNCNKYNTSNSIEQYKRLKRQNETVATEPPITHSHLFSCKIVRIGHLTLIAASVGFKYSIKGRCRCLWFLPLPKPSPFFYLLEFLYADSPANFREILNKLFRQKCWNLHIIGIIFTLPRRTCMKRFNFSIIMKLAS